MLEPPGRRCDSISGDSIISGPAGPGISRKRSRHMSSPEPTRVPERQPQSPNASSIEGLPAVERPAKFVIKVVGHIPS